MEYKINLRGVVFLVVAFICMLFFISFQSVHAAACPASDGGAGDDDSTTDGTITISSNATWTPADGTAFDCTGVDILITSSATLTINGDTSNGYIGQINTDNLTIDSGASISADEEGCTGGTGDGKGPNTGTNVCAAGTTGFGDGGSAGGTAGEGAAYGGLGGSGSNTGISDGTTTYGDAVAPALFGSSGGGGSGGTGGAGGGVVRLNITGTFTHNGEVSADGQDGPGASAAGGSGGSVYITTATMAGSTGTFTASGGNGRDNGSTEGGGGGGGRIAVTYTSSTFSFDSTDFDVAGGTAGNGGVSTAGAKGTVYVEETDANTVQVFHGFTYADDYSETTWTVDASATNQYCDASSDTSPSVSVTNFTFGGTVNCDDASLASFNLAATTSFSLLADSSLTVSQLASTVDWTVPAGTTLTFDNFTFTGSQEGTFTINDAIAIELQNSADIIANVDWTNLTTLTIDSGTTINASEKGCIGRNSDGKGPDTGTNICAGATTGFGDGGTAGGIGGEGGSYGGAGGASTSFSDGTAIYGDVLAPDLFGSSGGGGTGSQGGDGGGLVRLDVSGTFTHNGIISVDGEDGAVQAAGGGSGGSIYVTTATMAGSTGTFSADGGDGQDNGSNEGGGGGGGRIAVTYTSTSFSFDSADFSADGGTAGDGASVAGGNGTVYVEETDANSVQVFHGFTFDRDFSETTWVFDSSATNQYCDSSTDTTPSLTATSLTLGGTVNCDDASITSLNFIASTAFSITSGYNFTITPDESTVDWDLPDGITATFDNVTFNGSEEGLFTIDDALNISLTNSSDILANAQWTNLTDFSMASGTTINANALGCQGDGNNGQGPNTSTNVCANVTSGYGGGVNTGGGSGAGGGHGGAGGDSDIDNQQSGGTTYGSNTAPVLFGSSGGGSSNTGGHGGGLVRIDVAGNASIAGTISTDGGDGGGSSGRGTGGGSGGSIYITASGVLSGSGTLSADGGDGQDFGDTHGGGGGGGRIAVVYGSESSSFVSSLATGTNTVAGAAGGADANAGSNGTVYSADGYGPSITSSTTADDDGDGQIDQVILTMSEDVDGGTVAGGDFSVTGFTVASASRTASAQITIVLTESGSVDTDATPAISISGSIDDSSANSTTSGSSTPTDGAAPRITSITPADGESSVDKDTDIVITFSEGINTGSATFTLSETPDGQSTAWTNSDKTLTISHTSEFNPASEVTVTMTAAPDTAANALAGAIGGVTHPATFTTRSSSSTVGQTQEDPGISSGSVDVNGDPLDSAELLDDGRIKLTWDSAGVINYVNIYYSIDSGSSFLEIVLKERNFGYYYWTVPSDVTADSVLFKIEEASSSEEPTEFVTNDVDISSVTNIGDDESEESNSSQEQIENPTQTTETALSPITGEEEDVDMVDIGDFVRGISYDTVYYIDENYQRKPFMNAQVFFTWADDGFEEIYTVSDATLTVMEVGTPMLPKAGTVLVKIQSMPEVYHLEESGDGIVYLRWIPDEDTAIILYGEDWADYVIDIPETLFTKFSHGNSMSSDEEIDRDLLIKREELNG